MDPEELYDFQEELKGQLAIYKYHGVSSVKPEFRNSIKDWHLKLMKMKFYRKWYKNL